MSDVRNLDSRHRSAELTELEEKRRNRHIHGIEKEREEEKRKESVLGPYATYHLVQKAKEEKTTDAWLEQEERHLRDAVAYFGAETPLADLTPKECTRWVDQLRSQPNGRGGTLSESSVRKRLNSLSNLFKRAVSEEYVGRNPVADMFSKPTEERREAEYFEPEEAALLIEAARTYTPPPDSGAYPWIYPLLATFLLTGGRKSEVLGLEVDDVSFKLGKIYIRPNEWRRLKTRGSKRTVPLWPQLEEILRAYLVEREATGGVGRLLFPSSAKGGERMIMDLRKVMDTVALRAGLPNGSLRLHRARHTYTAARLQTCDRGRPVALYTVARELGHSSTAMIEDRYGHLHDRVEASAPEVVEYRIEAFRDRLGERLQGLEGPSRG